MNDFEQRVRRSLETVARAVPSAGGDERAADRHPRRGVATLAAAAAVVAISVPAGLVAWLARGDTGGPPASPTSASSTPGLASSPAPSGSPASATPPPQPTDADLRLVEAFVVFAELPTVKTAANVPFAPAGVVLGVGPRVITTLGREDLVDPAAWSIQPPSGYWRALTGPFSALAALARHVPSRDVRDMSTATRSLQVSLGEHPHCASPPVQPPRGLADLRRVSVQPAEGTITTCIQWFTVDLFVNDRGEIAAVTVDFWEP